MEIAQQLAQELNLKQWQVDNTIALIDEGNTIPFISRYRKEATGELNDEILRTFEERLTYLRNMQERKEDVKRIIEEQGNLTEELAAAIDACTKLTEIEDLYRPYRPKRKTRATVAKAKGLEPLADALSLQDPKCDPEAFAQNYVNPEKEVASIINCSYSERTYSDTKYFDTGFEKTFWVFGFPVDNVEFAFTAS